MTAKRLNVASFGYVEAFYEEKKTPTREFMILL